MGIDQHVKVVAALFILFGILLGVVAIVGLAVFGSPFEMIREAAQEGTTESMEVPMLRMYGAGVILMGLILAGPSIAAGIGLRRLRLWARDLTMVVSSLSLVVVPFGTLLALYSFWVMLSPEVDPLFHPRLE